MVKPTCQNAWDEYINCTGVVQIPLLIPHPNIGEEFQIPLVVQQPNIGDCDERVPPIDTSGATDPDVDTDESANPTTPRMSIAETTPRRSYSLRMCTLLPWLLMLSRPSERRSEAVKAN
ncbi:hypothetical protein PC129_g1743 [Phytophthora cactorum]|uniref:Uncharacterized protein n=1 Tax=Phytophthora cactorum TaxID=29920 RepID=A0A8T1CTA6_9STRA|nr:hypothetical protein Pcac1_g15002 [Phytophthora cactorum]KAG2817514.1 hypothetical protein PC111_g12689 [Phytophthora cactorum]KAG2817911.1 hypothetical protein PC112_g12859 [Phytophthora cactorum]KAG2852489.1 hypothetical protein PC113_g14993 [Phytophthora cactorum]KAG2893092.1 hypothetical protein PC114_g16388 [Phytophthora cactorum]